MKTPLIPPPKLPNRFCVDLRYVKKLSWKQRLQILIGYNIEAVINIMVDKRTGQVWESAKLNTTEEIPKPSN